MGVNIVIQDAVMGPLSSCTLEIRQLHICKAQMPGPGPGGDDGVCPGGTQNYSVGTALWLLGWKP